MALPTLDATFASSVDLPRKQMLAKWLVNLQYSGSIDDYYTLPEKYLYAKIAVASGATRSEADYISLPDRYVWSDIYKAVSGSSVDTIDRGEREALGWIAAAIRGDNNNPAAVATYIDWPWRYQVASIIVSLAVDSDAQSFITASGATDIEAIDKFVKGVKNLSLWNFMVCWPLRSSQNAGTGTTAYSLGGLGTYNGTLVNGPTWGMNGITFDGSNDRIETGIVPISGSAQRTLFAVSNSSVGSLNAIISINKDTPITGNTWGILHFPNNTSILGWDSNGANNISIGSVTSGVFSSISYGWSTERFGYINGSKTLSGPSVAPTTGSNSLVSIGSTRINGSDYYWNYNGIVAFAALFSTGSDATNIHSLYRNTLGANLSLP